MLNYKKCKTGPGPNWRWIYYLNEFQDKMRPACESLTFLQHLLGATDHVWLDHYCICFTSIKHLYRRFFYKTVWYYCWYFLYILCTVKKGWGRPFFTTLGEGHRLFLHWINGPDDTAFNSGEGFEKQATVRVLSPHQLFFWASCWYYWFHRFVLLLPGITNANTYSSCYKCSLFSRSLAEKVHAQIRETHEHNYIIFVRTFGYPEKREI